ncbi:hypothetical protein J3D48_006158 [Pseudomonas fluorescens]|nr:hypothetical protein [Pseudomonas fluorescens]
MKLSESVIASAFLLRRFRVAEMYSFYLQLSTTPMCANDIRIHGLVLLNSVTLRSRCQNNGPRVDDQIVLRVTFPHIQCLLMSRRLIFMVIFG